MSVRSNVVPHISEETSTEVERKLPFSLSFIRPDESRFMSVCSNVERRVSEETSTEVERKLPILLTFISG